LPAWSDVSWRLPSIVGVRGDKHREPTGTTVADETSEGLLSSYPNSVLREFVAVDHGQPALDYLHQVGQVRSRTKTLLLPKQACSRLHLCPSVVSQNGRDQSGIHANRCPNRRSPGPRTRRDSRLRHVLIKPVNEKSQASRGHRALVKLALLAGPSVTSASSSRGTYSPVARQNTHQCDVRG
jgi:hypothetical protein